MPQLPGREIPVSSWRELIGELHAPQLVKPRPEEGGHLRSPYVFRGVDVAKWELQTSLQRLPMNAPRKTSLIEHSLIRSFRKYASAGAFNNESEWYALAVGQHNGLPTRVLDWTASPLVAVHFACGKESHSQEDGVIWCLDAVKLREINEQSNGPAAKLTGISWVYDTRLLERSFHDLASLDATHSGGPLLLLWEPPSIDSRIANQSGLLSMMNDPDESQNDFLLTQCKTSSDLVIRIVIKAKAKAEIRDMLDQNGISERTIFPGLPGLCDWLKRYYGKAWQ
jgi:hypothetical protein